MLPQSHAFIPRWGYVGLPMADKAADALSAIYDAALSDEHWPRALELFSRSADGVGAILVAVDQVGLPFHIETASYPIDQVRYYFENFGHFDELSLGRMLPCTPPLQLLTDSEVWGDVAALQERPDYIWMRKNIDAYRKGGVRLSNNRGWTDMLALQFGNGWDERSERSRGKLQSFLPHLAKVVEINRQFAILRARYQAALAALDHIRIGTCILSHSGHLILANREARRIHDLDDGVEFSRAGSLVCGSSDATIELAEKIRAVTATSAGAGAASEFLFFATRKSGKRPFMIEVAPLRDSRGELENGLHGAIAFIIDPENQAVISTERLSQLFALTQAEAEVCRHMVGGLSALEIAEARGVAEGTIKTQFKAIYAKTGVHRRSELMRLALSVDPPIER